VEENICQLYISKGLIARIYRELKKLNSPKINEPMRKWAIELNRTFSTEEIPSLTIKGMQIKTTLRFYLNPVRIVFIINTTTNRCWQGCGEKGIFIRCRCF
jgi:hypothetical protein